MVRPPTLQQPPFCSPSLAPKQSNPCAHRAVRPIECSGVTVRCGLDVLSSPHQAVDLLGLDLTNTDPRDEALATQSMTLGRGSRQTLTEQKRGRTTWALTAVVPLRLQELVPRRVPAQTGGALGTHMGRLRALPSVTRDSKRTALPSRSTTPSPRRPRPLPHPRPRCRANRGCRGHRQDRQNARPPSRRFVWQLPPP